MNWDAFEELIDTIFENAPDDEHICFWSTIGKNPGYPVNEERLRKQMRGSKPRAAYFGTATMRPDPEDGRVYNRESLFCALYVLVLDDIGTGVGAKCHRDMLPEGLWDAASYRIETSPENFQLGYLLDEPIRDVYQAKEFVRLMYNAGPWDSGGALAAKLVRLPIGNNLKEKYGGWEVRMTHFDPQVYTPDQLLNMVDAGVSFADIVAGESDKRDPRRGRGTVPFSGFEPLYDLNGVVDPVAEWLREKGHVISEHHPWLDVICPFVDEHTDGEQGSKRSTGYSPLGWGEDDNLRARRGFNCFHDHCSGREQEEFFERIVDMGGPEAARFDPVAPLVSTYILNAASDKWINTRSPSLIAIKNGGFKTAHQRRVRLAGQNKRRPPTEYSLLVENPALIRVYGTVVDPLGEFIVELPGGVKMLNEFTWPNYGRGEYNEEHVSVFRGFMEYMLPNGDDAEWFIRHMAMKARSPVYRGPGVFMYTPVQGTGRGTFEDMLNRLWGESDKHYYSAGSLPGLAREVAGSSGTFNSHLAATWVMLPETLGENVSARDITASYESLKRFIDPRPVSMLYKEKYGAQWQGKNYSSVVMASNHEDGLKIDVRDRRIKRMANTLDPADDAYFELVNTAIEDHDWRTSVWRYLLDYDVGDYTGFEPIVQELDDLLGYASPVERALRLIEEYCLVHTDGIFVSADIYAFADQHADMLGLTGLRNDWHNWFKDALRKASHALHPPGKPKHRFKLKGRDRSYAIRAFTDSALMAEMRMDRAGAATVREAYAQFNPNTMAAVIRSRLEDLGQL